MGIATAIIAIGIAVTTAVGPERRGAKFELAKVAGVQEDVRRKDVDVESQGGGEKTQVAETEYVPEKQ